MKIRRATVLPQCAWRPSGTPRAWARSTAAGMVYVRAICEIIKCILNLFNWCCAPERTNEDRCGAVVACIYFFFVFVAGTCDGAWKAEPSGGTVCTDIRIGVAVPPCLLCLLFCGVLCNAMIQVCCCEDLSNDSDAEAGLLAGGSGGGSGQQLELGQQSSAVASTAAWMSQQQAALPAAEKVRLLAEAAASSPALTKANLKPGDRVCRRAKVSSTGVVLRLYDDADANPRYANMAQIDFSESKGSKVRVLSL